MWWNYYLCVLCSCNYASSQKNNVKNEKQKTPLCYDNCTLGTHALRNVHTYWHSTRRPSYVTDVERDLAVVLLMAVDVALYYRVWWSPQSCLCSSALYLLPPGCYRWNISVNDQMFVVSGLILMPSFCLVLRCWTEALWENSFKYSSAIILQESTYKLLLLLH